MWLKVCRKADCFLLDETLGQYRKGRIGSVSTHSIKTMIGWHYKLYHEAECMYYKTKTMCYRRIHQ